MKSKTHRFFRDSYARYQTLLTGRKQTSGPGVDLSRRKPNHQRWNADTLAATHGTDPVAMIVEAEIQVDRLQNFKFKLRAPSFNGTPLLHYDSDGISHRNRDADLPDQYITTPHFNCYDAHGRGLAYKTTPLRNPTTARQLENIDHCVIHFYEEANITHSPAGELPLTSSLNADPHARVTHFG